MSISVSAAETKLPVEVLSLHWLRWNESTLSSTGLQSWNTTTNDNFNFNGVTLADPQQLFLGVTLDSIIRADQIIVWSFTITNTESASLSSKLRSYSTSGFEEKVSYNTLKGLTYDITILTETRQIIDENTNTVRFTITGKIPSAAEGKNGIIWWMRDLTLADTAQYNRVVSQVNVYESVQAAAGSGTTPEEMREVLSQWTEEELGPVIKDNVQEGVQAGMEEALENEKEQAHGGASGSIDDVTGALEGVTADMEEVTEKVEEFIRSFAYQGTTAVITFPALDVPVLGHISDAITIDMGQKATEMIPSQLLLMLRVAMSIGLVLYPVWETIKLFKKLLDD